jgi:hypothetical protein
VTAGGAVLFARYAYPPNELGYCGPDDPAALLQYTAAGAGGPGLAHLARQFAGAWPYLCLIAGANGRSDPLDADVVEAYWVGNGLLRRVGGALFAAHLADRFGARAGRGTADIAELAVRGAPAHHNFHVFAVYPWVGLLRAGTVDHPLRVLDACRVRWGRVTAVAAGRATVSSRPLCWDGRRLLLAPERTERAVVSVDGAGLAPAVRTGDVVSLHWNWVCDVLRPRQVTALRRATAHVLALTNDALARPVTAAVLG